MARPVLAAAAVVLVVSGCGGGGGSMVNPCPAKTTVDTKDGINFVPKCVTINPGETVTWRILDAVPHTVTFTTGGDFDKYFEKGQTVTRAFPGAGRFEYYCKVHTMRMSGTIVVASPAPTPSS